MIELPFTLTIDYFMLSTDSDFITEKEKYFNEDIFCKLLSEIQEINPAPILKVYADSTDFYEEISGLANNANINVIFYFYYNENLNNLPDKSNVNLIFKINTPELYKKINFHKNHSYNLIIEPSSDFDNSVKSELEKIKQDRTIKNLFLQPYLTEKEIENYSENILNRKFLTCAAAWLNPIIDSNGNIYCCKNNKIGNISKEKLMDIWNNDPANSVRGRIIKEKNLKQCSSCLKKYNDNFLIVDNNEVDYNGNKYIFPSEINYVVSAPKIAITGQQKEPHVYLAEPYAVFSDEDITSPDGQILLLLG